MSLIEFNFNQDESDKRADIFCLKNVLSDTHFYDFVKKIPSGKKSTTNVLLNSEKL